MLFQLIFRLVLYVEGVALVIVNQREAWKSAAPLLLDESVTELQCVCPLSCLPLLPMRSL